ncbi:transcriptional regulator with XRE-family HTH domain [Rhodanobacter sp. K2T2]|uniref:helix-turn-helix domain-containing protein n=1 Tax=Rhodanobacter sp. K2T2 TaxID=2723085 RepID=UPI0015C99429|nr:helix-turn-helix transcriptional regulator [Rhodanobacter sp. K2T2]NYE31126.1 transcriptional regulator with XRE-family HTH domain [Rhodanobacter sp. K2T2]
MPAKSIHKDEYSVLLRRLRELRTTAGMTQVDLSTALQRPQSYVSDVERGSRRMDLLQLREFCNACESSLTEFVDEFEQELGQAKSNRRSLKQQSR